MRPRCDHDVTVRRRTSPASGGKLGEFAASRREIDQTRAVGLECATLRRVEIVPGLQNVDRYPSAKASLL